MVTIGTAEYFRLHPARTVRDSDFSGSSNNRAHLLVGHHALHFNINAYIGRTVFIGLG